MRYQVIFAVLAFLCFVAAFAFQGEEGVKSLVAGIAMLLVAAVYEIINPILTP